MMKKRLSQGEIHYEAVGDGRPILVMHGGYLDHRHMLDALEPVFRGRNGWRRLYIDLPGHGQSAVDSAVTSQKAVLDLVLEFVDALMPAEGFVVAGESRGGYLARGIVHQRPDQVEGALFIVPGRHTQASEGSVPEHSVLVRAAELEKDLSDEERRRVDRLVVQNAEILAKIRRLKIPASALADLRHLESVDGSYEFPFDADRLDRPFGRPALFLLGRQDAMVGYKDALGVIEQFPRGTFAVLDRAGHSLAWEQPALFEALVAEWLDRVEEAGRIRGHNA